MVWGPNPRGVFTIKVHIMFKFKRIHPILKPSYSRRCGNLISLPKWRFLLRCLSEKNYKSEVDWIYFSPSYAFDCAFCQEHPEYVQHLFAECFFARNVWGCSSTFSSLHEPNHDFIGWLSQLPCNAQSQEFDHLSKAILICWQIWEARNNLIFHSTQPHPTRCVHDAAVVGLDYWQQNHIVKPKASSPMAIKWHAPCWLDQN